MCFYGKIPYSAIGSMTFFERKVLLEKVLPKLIKEEAKYQYERDKSMVNAIGAISGVANIAR